MWPMAMFEESSCYYPSSQINTQSKFSAYYNIFLFIYIYSYFRLLSVCIPFGVFSIFFYVSTLHNNLILIYVILYSYNNERVSK